MLFDLLQALELFKKQEVDFLIATDVAARVSDFVLLTLLFFFYFVDILHCLVLVIYQKKDHCIVMNDIKQ